MRTTIAFILLLLSAAQASSEEVKQDAKPGLYEIVLRDYESHYPRDLEQGDSVLKWWPLNTNPHYRYYITHFRDNPDMEGTEFTLEIKQDKQNANRFVLDVSGYNEFPYKELVIKENRIFTVSNEGREWPLITFPLFEHMMFADDKYELQFLRELIRYQHRDGELYGPLNTNFWQVNDIKGDVYIVDEWSPRGVTYEFRKGFGMQRWELAIGVVIDLIETEDDTLGQENQK